MLHSLAHQVVRQVQQVQVALFHLWYLAIQALRGRLAPPVLPLTESVQSDQVDQEGLVNPKREHKYGTTVLFRIQNTELSWIEMQSNRTYYSVTTLVCIHHKSDCNRNNIETLSTE